MSDNDTEQDNKIGQALDAMMGDDKSRRALVKQLNKMLESTVDKEKTPVKAQPKVVRDSFTLPEDDYQLMLDFQDKAMDFRFKATKGEILRAGLHALQKLDDKSFIETLESVEKLKPGRRKES